MAERCPHVRTWTSLLLFLLFLHHASAANVAISPPSDVRSTSVSASASSANQRSVRSADPANSLTDAEEDEDGCSSDFVEKFFRLLSGPVGKESEALVAAVLKVLSENDRVNWPIMADWPQPDQSRDLVPAASKLREMFLDGARRIRGGSEKRLAPKFNPTGWRRRRSVDTAPYLLDPSFLRLILAKLRATRLLEEDDAFPKMPEDDVNKLVPAIPEWQEEGKRSRPRNVPDRVSRRRQPERLPKRKPLEFNPTGW